MINTQSSADEYRRLLGDTRRLYADAARRVLREHPELAPEGDFAALMEDLHRGLCLRVYLTICEADRRWSPAERRLATELCDHLWGERLEGATLAQAMRHASQQTARLEWPALVRPFFRLAPLRDEVPALENLVIRQTNLIGRADGLLKPAEQQASQRVLGAVRQALGCEPGEEGREHGAEPTAAPSVDLADPFRHTAPPGADEKKSPGAAPDDAAAARPIDQVLADLDRLVGLAGVKHEVRSLANYIAMQQRRAEAGLPATEISLHLVFTGAPGTGKTTVARLLGEALCTLGVLPGGQLVETDRSGLVAEYAGQTGPKTNAKVDEALGGVLFVDEAYGLVASDSEDPFGREAVQALLKRAEDDRHRLAVVLAGYPDEMHSLLGANPGLRSRFAKTIHFDDYTPLELCEIFGLLLEKFHYEVTPPARLRIAQAIAARHARRTRHFGNGREVRNLFEQAILNMANRLATIPKVTDEQLVTLEADDIPLGDAAGEAPQRVTITCGSCGHAGASSPGVLGRRVRCPKCDDAFLAQWCELAPTDA
ncbi:AAA family ATPase [Botrimarina sp.]|uniref:AAA family ATPase n=1 Tax=Botrimarina sp. TaxID=2795802 RepID=UPI0032EAF885